MTVLKRLLLVMVAGACQIAALAQARYVFYFIGDGMGWGHVNATQYYNRIVRGSEDPLLMMQFPVVGSAITYSASAPVTDSAAAGTALATGYKTNNSMLGLSPDTLTAYSSVASRLKNAGWGVGVLSSLSADDATPAAFYAHQPKRGMRYEIDCDAAVSGFDFIGGANLKGMKKDNDVLSRMIANGYTLVRDIDAPEAKNADKIILLSPQDKSDIGYTIDSIPGAFNLPDMTRMALNHVSDKFPEHFFLMVEAGNIDHAAHANDGGTVIKEILAFQEAIKIAYDFYLLHPNETLIVVTADHDTGGMSLNNKINLAAVDSQRMSKEAMSGYFREMIKDKQVVTWSEMKKFLGEKLGFWKTVRVNDEQKKKLKSAFNKTFVKLDSKDERGLYSSFDEFVTAVYEVMNYRIGTYFTTRGHSAGMVPVFAIGHGAERFGSVMDNTEIPMKILEATR